MSKDIKKPVGETRRYVGIDLGDKKSRVCILDERGEIVLQEWVETTPEAFFKRFRGEAKMDIAMEVGMHSRWASDLLGRCGHKMVVADARQLGLITKSNAKSDKRDARTLAQLLRADRRLRDSVNRPITCSIVNEPKSSPNKSQPSHTGSVILLGSQRQTRMCFSPGGFSH